MLDVLDTIVAIASATGPAVRGIVRISGPVAVDLVAMNFVADDTAVKIGQLQKPDRADGSFQLDDKLTIAVSALVWPDQRSYTRQPTVEIHSLGSQPILRMIVDRLLASGARLAQPGEFTLRAFLSGRLDLTQAEAVLAVIDAKTEDQFDVALQQLAGGLAAPLAILRNRLLDVLAEIEAGLDFVEEDIQFISTDQTLKQLSQCQTDLSAVIQQIDRRDLNTDLPRVVLVGLPNSGKSSLFNALTLSAQAIVTDIAGTTTDYVTATVTLSRSQVELVDTAGFEIATGQISADAQQHREQQHRHAALKILCIDGQLFRDSSEGQLVLNDDAQSPWLQQQLAELSTQDLIVATKSDLVIWQSTTGHQFEFGDNRRVLLVSSKTEAGLETLRQQIESATGTNDNFPVSVVGSTVQRASSSLRSASTCLGAAIAATGGGLGEEIVAAEIRESLNSLALVVGTVYTDDILDLVFGRFCIGK